MATIPELIEGKIKNLNVNISEIVATQLAEKEINRRVEIVLKAIETQKALDGQLKKIDRDDQVTYVGGERKTFMSEQRFKEVKSLKEKVEKFNKVFEEAIAGNDAELYKKLTDVIAQSSQGQKGGNQQEESKEE